MKNSCWMMGACRAQSDEEFAAWLKERERRLVIFPIIGLAAILFVALNAWQGWVENDYMEGVTSGMGAALIAVAIVMTLRNRRICKRPELLHKMRLRYTDERNQEVGNRALSATAYITMLACWVALTIAGWFSMVAFYCFYGVFFFILICYLLCSLYYNKKM